MVNMLPGDLHMIFACSHEYSHWRPAGQPGSGLKHVPYGNLVSMQRTSHRVMQIMRGLVVENGVCICIVTQTSAAIRSSYSCHNQLDIMRRLRGIEYTR